MDKYLFKNGLQDDSGKELVFKSKTWIPIGDNNGTSYTSKRVNFDLASIANSGEDYFNPSESMVQIPLVLSVRTTNTTASASLLANNSTTATQNAFVAGLKNGSYNIINSINYKINGNEIITNDRCENMKINYEVLSTWNTDTMLKRGEDLHFYKDDANSLGYSSAHGVYNNVIDDVAFASTTGFTNDANVGKRERMRRTSINPSATEHSPFMDVAKMQQSHNDYVVVDDLTNNNVQCLNYMILASFKLGDLHPLFRNMPLTKNISQYLSIELNVNTIATTTYSTAHVITGVSLNDETNTLPYQLTAAGRGLPLRASNGGTIETCLSVRKGIFGSTPTHDIGRCEFQACFVRLNDVYNDAYLSDSIRNIVYNECYAQFGSELAGVGTTSTVNQLISGNFRKLRKLIIMPFLASSANVIGLSPIKSPFSSEPSTLSPCLKACDNLQVRVGTKNVYQKALQYDWEQFTNEVQPDNVMNGAMDNELMSGLISRSDWQKCYGFKVVDLSRIVPENDMEPKQITVQFTNNSVKAMDYYVFVYYEKSMELTISTGDLTL